MTDVQLELPRDGRDWTLCWLHRYHGRPPDDLAVEPVEPASSRQCGGALVLDLPDETSVYEACLCAPNARESRRTFAIVDGRASEFPNDRLPYVLFVLSRDASG